MKTLLNYLVVFIPFMLSAQDCDIILPQDTMICGFSQEFLIQPEGGIWSFDCGASPQGMEQGVSITNLGNGFCLFNFNSCGIFELVYTYEEVGVCFEIDTFLVYVDDPSNSAQIIDFENSLDYDNYSCHSGGSAECINTLSFGGETAPVPVWQLCGDGSCQATIYDPVVTPNPNDPCLPFDVQIQAITAGSTYSSCWSGEQDSFIVVDTESGEVLENDFLAYLDSLGLADIFANLTDCTVVNNSCFTIGQECIDSIKQDTSELLIPVHLGGNWNLLLAQDTIAMQDTTNFSLSAQDYLLIIEPGADYYGPDDIDLSLYELTNNDTIMPSGLISFQMLWTENWIYDTLEIITPEIVYKDSLGCKPCGGNISASSFNVPEIPAYDCGAISISFDFTCACMEVDLWAISSPINCQDCGNLSAGSGDPSVVFEWSGPGIGNVLGADVSGVCIPGDYTVVAIDSYGCVASTTVPIIEDINQVYAGAGVPDVITSTNPCVSLNGSATSDFPTSLIITWSGPNGFSSNDLNPTVCAAGNYNLHVYDSWSQCEDQISVTVEEMIVIIEEIDAEICSGDCFELNGQEFCESGFYTVQASPSLIYEINLIVVESPEVIIVEPPMLTATQNCVDLIIESTGVDLSNYTFSWQGPDGFSASSDNVLVCNEGEYVLTVEESNFACTSEYIVHVIRFDELIVNLCEGDCFEFGNQMYCDEEELTIETGLFNVTDLEINLLPLSTLFIEQKFCSGELVELYGETFTSAGVYDVLLPGANVCDTLIEIQLTEFERIPELDDEFIEVCKVEILDIGTTVSLEENVSYTWMDGKIGAIRAVNDPGVYELTIATQCESRSQLFEIVETIEDESDAVYIPNIFSPNNDGLNEEFIVQSGVELLNLEVQVFDRWGNSMFSTSSIDEGWDGTYNNSKVATNSYVYIVEYSTASCDDVILKKTKTGTVTVMR